MEGTASQLNSGKEAARNRGKTGEEFSSLVRLRTKPSGCWGGQCGWKTKGDGCDGGASLD